MDQAKKKKIIWISIISLVLIGLLLLIFKLRDVGGPAGPEVIEQPEFIPPSANLEYDPTMEPSLTNTEFTVINLAKSYAERFGSWSTDNLGHNLEELLPLSSNRMKNYLNSIKLDPATEFNGITTKSISAEILFIDTARAEVMVRTQRITTDDSLAETVSYQDIQISLVNSGNTWLVDTAFWQ